MFLRIWDRIRHRRVETFAEYIANDRAAELGEPVDDPDPYTEPFNCPRCNCRIERHDDGWRCAGLVSRVEVDTYLAPWHRGTVPAVVVEAPSCGWHAAHADFGKTWV